MTLSAATKIELIETALADGKYRTLQRQLRELKDAGRITTRYSLSNSHDLLKAEAQRLIDELRPIAETQNSIETVEQKTDEVLAPLSTGTITETSDFGDHTSDIEAPQDATVAIEQKVETASVLEGIIVERVQVKLYFNADNICLGGCADDYWLDCYNGDYVASEFFKMTSGTNPDGMTRNELIELQRTTSPFAIKAAAIKEAISNEAEIYKAEFEAVVASLPVYTVVTNRDFQSRVELGTAEEKTWLKKKVANLPESIVILILKTNEISSVSFAGDALRLIALFGTRSLVENGALKTYIPMLDLEGILHKAKKQGFNIRVSDADKTVVLSRAS